MLTRGRCPFIHSSGSAAEQQVKGMSQPQQAMILRTKLYRPAYEEDVVLRPDLIRRLEAGLRHALTLVSAPAGFGKSTLVSAWLEQCSSPSAWLSLDPEDNDLALFVSYVIAAVRTVYPGACAETEALAGLGLPATAALLARQLINDLDALAGPFVLVLDDYDRIENSAIHDLVSILVQRPPRPLRLVVTARRDPPLALARLRAGGRMTEVRMADLRLTSDEVAAFWRKKPQEGLDDGGIAKLDSVVEGWPAGLRLAAISLHLSANPQQTVDALASTNVHAQDYLFREIFASIPAARQRALVRLAQLDRFCSSLSSLLCTAPEARGQAADSENLVEWLQATNLFLIPLDSTGTWYRFHHLFLQLLRREGAKLLDVQTIAALHTCAADWYAERGLLDNALAEALLIPSETRALAIVEQQRVTVLNAEDWPRMRRWLEIFSPGFFEQAPALWMVKAAVLVNRFRLAELSTLLARLDAYPVYAAEVAAMRSQVFFWQGDAAGALAQARTALAGLPPALVHPLGNALIMLGLALQISGDQDAGFNRLMHELSSTGPKSSVITTRVLLALTGMHWAAANLDHVLRFARRMLDLGEQHHLWAIRSWAHYFLGCVYYWRNELGEAEREFAAVVDQPQGAHAMVVLQSHFGLALCYTAGGRAPETGRLFEALFAWTSEAGNISLLNMVEAFAAHIALLQGNHAAARAWAARRNDVFSRLPLYFLGSPQLTLVQICLTGSADGQLGRAAAVLNAAGAFLAETHNTLRSIDVVALEALLHQAAGRPEAALEALRQALLRAEPAGVIRPFVDLGAEMGALLHEAAKRGPAAAHATRVLAAFPHRGQQAIARATLAPGDAADDVLEPLTDRELEVLALLAQRLSNKEIGEVLVVSPITVKSHLRNLFGKLGVGGRRVAVERGRSLGLLR
jgi:LuxR family maltose regulon positive regulatory protein